MLEGSAFIGQWASNIKRIWHDKLKAEMTTAPTLPEQDWRTVPRFSGTPPPPLGIEVEAPSQPIAS